MIMMGRRNNTFFYTMVFFIAMIAFLVYNTDARLQIQDEYLELFGPSIFLIICLFSVKNTSGASYVGSWFFTGVALAYLASTLNTLNMWIPTLLVNSGINLQYLQVLMIIGSTGLGIMFEKS